MLILLALLALVGATALRKAIRRKQRAAARIQQMAEARLDHYRRQDVARAVATAAAHR